MIVLRHERKWYVLEEPLGEAPPANAPAAARNAYKKHSDDLLDVGCLMFATMSPYLQTGLMNTNGYDIIYQLRDMFQTQAHTECYDATNAFNECKMIKGTSVSDHVMKIKRHMDHLERLSHPVPLQLATDTILNSLSEDYKPFVINYNMNNMEKSIAELHSMLKTAELNMGAKNKTKDVLMVRDGRVKKKHGHGGTSNGKGPVQVIQSAPKVRENVKGKGKGKKVKPNKARTENRCFTCNEVGHWRQNCPKRHEAGKLGVNPDLQVQGNMVLILVEEYSYGRSSVDLISSNPASRIVEFLHNPPFVPVTFVPRVLASATTDEVPEYFTVKPKKDWDEEEREVADLASKCKRLLIMAIPNDIFESLDHCETSMELWCEIQKQLEGGIKTLKNNKTVCINEYHDFKAKEGESLKETYSCLNVLINKCRRSGVIRS
ncbi:hypothetical protein OSB04_028026 [Centaurea solstitialis]|uniref:CCHC-type domain-containing protein n=1 Tax=Centaurea solstitialis TaxID=347529 RepID=A0AA38W7C6_9ASTR|nr:hypothetical protein OSB04_028026 [Centaurea solstitialis]